MPNHRGGVRNDMDATMVLSVGRWLVSTWRAWAQTHLLSCHENLPRDRRGRAASLASLAIEEVAFLVAELLHRSRAGFRPLVTIGPALP